MSPKSLHGTEPALILDVKQVEAVVENRVGVYDKLCFASRHFYGQVYSAMDTECLEYKPPFRISESQGLLQ